MWNVSGGKLVFVLIYHEAHTNIVDAAAVHWICQGQAKGQGRAIKCPRYFLNQFCNSHGKAIKQCHIGLIYLLLWIKQMIKFPGKYLRYRELAIGSVSILAH